MQAKRSYGYKDLDHLVEHPPKQLQFTIELLQVEDAMEVDKEIWLMNEEEMKQTYPICKQEGNQLFYKKLYQKASIKYRKALAILEELMMREKPNDEDWIKLDKAKIPLLSNLAQCELFLDDYYQALLHIDEVIEKDPNNVKALFRRAKANAAVWNVTEAKNDFTKVAQLESNLVPLVNEQLLKLHQKVKEKNAKDLNLLKGKLF